MLMTKLRDELIAMIDTEPTKAIEKAHMIDHGALSENVYTESLKAGVLIEAGSRVGKKETVKEGVERFRKLIEKNPRKSELHYNLANGLRALADLVPYTDFDWYLKTNDICREAKSFYRRAVSFDKPTSVCSLASTNLGNVLWKAHRWVEAYDAYIKALKYDQTNVVAATGAAKVLLRCIEHGIGNREILISVTARHLEVARKHPDRIKELAGEQAYLKLVKLLELPIKGGQLPTISLTDKYEVFVAANRLALSPTIEGLDPSMKRWDSLKIQSFAETKAASSGVPPIFAMFNILKSEYLLARFLAYQAITSEMLDSGVYSDTLDYANYGMKSSMLTLSQRACVDVLDKIAVATSEYFSIMEPKESIKYVSRWTEIIKGKKLMWHPKLRKQIERGNTAIIALTEISLDMRKGGFLRTNKNCRDSSTHRFTVLHDQAYVPSRPSDYIEHWGIKEYESIIIESLQLARAAILYFVEMVQIGEKAKIAHYGPTVMAFVPNHHWVRGEE